MKIDSQKRINLDNIQALRNTLYPNEMTTLGNGYYDGIVTRCIDTDKPGWVRVTILGLTDSLPVLDQPWAEPSPGQADIMPSPGAHVLVSFKDGDIYYPVWHSASRQNNGKFMTKEALKEYPHNHVMYRNEDGTSITNNTKSGQMSFDHSSGTSMTFKKDGKVELGGHACLNPLTQKFPVATGAVICPYLASLAAASGGAAANIFHPTNDPSLVVDDTISVG